MSKILVDYGEKKQLAQMLSVSVVTIRSALAGKTKSSLADRIRTLALERGGKQQTK